MSEIEIDVRAENHGTLWLMRPMTETGKDWLEIWTDGDWFGGALAVEHRFAQELIEGMQLAGLEIGA